MGPFGWRGIGLFKPLDVVIHDLVHLARSVHLLRVVRLRLGTLGTGSTVDLQCVDVVVGVLIRAVVKVTFRRKFILLG